MKNISIWEDIISKKSYPKLNEEKNVDVLVIGGGPAGMMSAISAAKENDEVILDKSEHASNLLPWIVLAEKIGFKIKYAELDQNNNLTVENIVKEITPKYSIILRGVCMERFIGIIGVVVIFLIAYALYTNARKRTALVLAGLFYVLNFGYIYVANISNLDNRVSSLENATATISSRLTNINGE